MNPSILVGGPFGPDQDKDDEMSQSKDFEDPNCEDETKAEKLEIEREKLIRVDQIWDKKTRKYRFVKTAKPKNRKGKFSKYVITVARRISTQGTFEGHYVVDIRGEHIQRTLSEAYQDVEGLSFPALTSFDTGELKLLFHALPTFHKTLNEEIKKPDPDQSVVFELEAAIQFVKEHFESTIAKLDELPDDHRDFETLWTLFPPHCLVYSTDILGQEKVYRMRSSKYDRSEDGSVFFVLNMDYIDADGVHVGYVRSQSYQIPEYSGSTSLYDLPYYPLFHHTKFLVLWERMIARSNKILNLKGRHLQEYKGHALDEEGEKFNSHGRVIVDPVTFDQTVPNNTVIPIIRKPLIEDKLTDFEKILINPLLYGFSLGDKIWGAFAVSQLEKVTWNEKIVESLVLDEHRKNFIRALVRYHGQKDDSNRFDDFVRDKGKGLVGLLSGPPGVGKTLTAEAVAEIAHRPLYSISSGELGESSSILQTRLIRVMELAETWRAVVLLDEADVFLTERSDEDLSRNAITSIFLRHLEYYQGILLLTTNRLDSFDKAFQSRIHFCFKYDALDVEARYSIWQTFVGRAKALTNVEVCLEENDIRKLADNELNGRQIKNIMGIAQSVAAEKNEPITLDSILLAKSFAMIPWNKPNEGFA